MDRQQLISEITFNVKNADIETLIKIKSLLPVKPLMTIRTPKPSPTPRVQSLGESIDIYTDGSSFTNDSNHPGGWGFVVYINGKMIEERYGGEKISTNNRMELTALERGLFYILGSEQGSISSVVFHIDSMYVINSFRGMTIEGGKIDYGRSWVGNWRKNNWNHKVNLSNKEIIIQIHDLILKVLKVGIELHFKHVPAHKGDIGNERADELAKKGCKMAEELD